MNHPFLISLFIHLAFCALLLFTGVRNRPHAMTIPTQTIRWVNISAPVAPSVNLTTPVSPKKSARPPKTIVEETAIVVPEKPRNLPEPEPAPANPVASPAPLPETIIDPGSSVQTGVAGLPGAAGVKVDDPDFTFIYYLNIIRNRISEYWQPPRLSANQVQNRQTMVVFRIAKSGKISDIRIEQPSGNFIFDQAAQRALYETAKLPPLPDEYGGKELTVHIEFESLR